MAKVKNPVSREGAKARRLTHNIGRTLFGSDDNPGIADVTVEPGHTGIGIQVDLDSVPKIQRSAAGLNHCFARFFCAFAPLRENILNLNNPQILPKTHFYWGSLRVFAPSREA
jgi:hypothetical protein